MARRQTTTYRPTPPRDKGTSKPVKPQRDPRDRMRHRLRHQIRVHVALAALAVTGGVVHLAVVVSGARGSIATVAVVGALVAAGIAWATPRLPRPAAPHLLGAGVWLALVALAGLGWDTLAVLLVGGYAASLPYLRRHRIPDPPPHQPEPEPVEDLMSPPALWAQNIATGALTGSYLTAEVKIPTGEQYDCHLVPGKQTLAGAQGSLASLRTGLRLRPGQDLILEQHPTADESVIRVTIVRRGKVLTVSQTWPGSTYHPADGTIAMGPYVDGEGTAVWLVHADNRLFGGFLVGSTGSGKSRLLESLALGYVEAGATVWFGDPQSGASSPFLARQADWFARDLDGILAMLRAARRVKRLRQAENALNDWEGWTPTQGRSPLLIVIDECHSALAEVTIQALVAELAREGGKVGIALILASQVPTLDAFGGGAGSEAIRSSVVAGNLVLMRIKSKNAKSVLSGVDVDPSAFPRVPGYGFLVDDTGTRRSAPFRGFYLADETRDEAAAQVTWPELDPTSAGAAGAVYTGRREKEEVDRAALAETIAVLTAGLDPDEGGDKQPGTAPMGPLVPYQPPLWPPQDTAQPATQQPADGKRTAPDVIADLLAQGVTSPGELETRSGYSETQVRNALRQLAEQGRARRVRHGVWEPVK